MIRGWEEVDQGVSWEILRGDLLPVLGIGTKEGHLEFFLKGSRAWETDYHGAGIEAEFDGGLFQPPT